MDAAICRVPTEHSSSKIERGLSSWKPTAHGISNNAWDSTRKALSHQQSSPQYSLPLPSHRATFESFITAHDAFRADPTLHFQAHGIPSPQIPGMPRNTQLPQATPERIITSQPRAVPNFMAQRPHCTAQGMPRKHQAQATHRNSTNDPTIPTSPAGTYSLNKVPLSQFPTHWVRSLQAEALLWHPDPTVRCLRSAMVPHGTLLEDTWQPIPESPAP